MTDTFYAIYSPSKDKWLDENDEFGPFAKAVRFSSPSFDLGNDGDQRWVGPCNEGDYK